MLLLPQGSTARAGARSAASSFPSSPHFFHLSLTYADSCDKKSHSSLLNRNFCGVSSLRVSEKQLSGTKLCREERRLPSQRQPQCGRVKEQAQVPPQRSLSPGIPFCVSKSHGELRQKNCRNRHMVTAPGDLKKNKNKKQTTNKHPKKTTTTTKKRG